MRSTDRLGRLAPSWGLALLAATAIGCGSKPQLPRESPEFLNTLVLEAAEAGRIDTVKDLFSRGANPDAFEADTHDGDTLLIIACRKNNLRLAQVLLDAGANPNVRQRANFSDKTPLVACAGSGHHEIVQLLLEHGANVDARVGIDGAGPTALYWAALNGHIGAVTALMASGAVVDRRELLAAVSQGHVEIVQRLLNAGGDPRWVLSNGRTVLEEAQRSPIQNRAKMTAAVRRSLGQ